ncbi:hypothetical protein FHS95_000841 [Sphingomonas naasensis]|uniref:Uncharacterized protein n=1 Tax=Sphingomonas naasensis TaxID=1344951 RepID=A0A4S1WVS2_9SPHN|nr:hypothetical protein [Sphingomonas naasensis]NIJ19172.1 hypothetical protein [Sphingomonas naasensis]TGX46360.1 hypothetical protein E5A74_04200 [Sphingomonas naasensis]
MRHVLWAMAIAPAFLVNPQPACAQGFLKRLAERAVEKAEERVERIVEDPGTGSTAPASSGGDVRGRGREAAPAAVMTPRAVRGGPPRAAPATTEAAPTRAPRYTDDIAKPSDAEALRIAYNLFGEVRCNDCEGGIDFDGRPKYAYDQFSGQYEERARRAGSWQVGHVHRWQGKAAAGTLTVLTEETIDGFRCRRLKYQLVKGKASAARPSLICWGLANRSSSTENWHEIY